MAAPPSGTVTAAADTMTPAASSSSSVTVRLRAAPLYPASPLAAVWVNTAEPSTTSGSSAAVTRTVCAVFQLVVEKVRLAGAAERLVSSPVCPRWATATVTAAPGAEASFTVQTEEPPSGTRAGAGPDRRILWNGVPVATAEGSPSPVALKAMTRTV